MFIKNNVGLLKFVFEELEETFEKYMIKEAKFLIVFCLCSGKKADFKSIINMIGETSFMNSIKELEAMDLIGRDDSNKLAFTDTGKKVMEEINLELAKFANQLLIGFNSKDKFTVEKFSDVILYNATKQVEKIEK